MTEQMAGQLALIGELPAELRSPVVVYHPGDWKPHYPGWRLVLEFTAYGQPIGQGQISFLGKGRPAIHKNGKTLHPWRDTVKAAAIEAAIEARGIAQLEGAVVVDRYYTVPRPKAKKSQRPHPTVSSATNSDIDHFDRAVFDSLSKSGVIADDALIIGGTHWKDYPGNHPLCPPDPGVYVRIHTEMNP